MPRLVLTNAYVVFASNDISSYVTSLGISTSYDIIETTGLGNTARQRVAGLADNQATFEFNQDYAVGALEALVYPTLGTAVQVKVRPVNAAISTSNPEYTFSALVSEWQPLSGAVGELATVSTSWPISGTISKATA